ncbi:hypothetical protein KY361_01890 [Candidatus Woesearchaeota archaeon]|nr:hypothetical protein [Candidatus Woesearchaeota archaeon]
MVPATEAKDVRYEEAAWRREVEERARKRLAEGGEEEAERRREEIWRQTQELRKTREDKRRERLEAELRRYQGMLKGEVGIEDVLDKKLGGYRGLTPRQMSKHLSRDQLRMHAHHIRNRMAILQDRIVTVLKNGARELAYFREVVITDYKKKEGLLEKRRLSDEEQEFLRRHIGRRKLDREGRILLKKQINHDKFLEAQKKKAVKQLGMMKREGFNLIKLKEQLAKIEAESDDIMKYWEYVEKTGTLPHRAFLWRGRPHWAYRKDFPNRVLRRISRFNDLDITFPFRHLKIEHMKYLKGIDNIIRWTDKWEPERVLAESLAA